MTNTEEQIESAEQTPRITELYKRYNLSTNCTPEQAYAAFRREYDTWIKKLSWAVVKMKKMDFDDVYQDLMFAAWEAANDKDFSPDKGKTLVGWMHQMVRWRYLTTLRKRNPDMVLSQFQLEGEASPEERLLSLDAEGPDMMSASRGLTQWARRLDAGQLLEAAIQSIRDLPEKYKAPLMELLDPSPAFVHYCYARNDEGQYKGAYAFEICSSRDLFAFTGSNKKNLEVAVRYVLKKVPEIREFIQECHTS